MAVQARTNAFGQYLFGESDPLTETSYYNNGTTSTKNRTPTKGEVHSCFREGKSNNPLTTIAGVKNYRRPSAYKRSVIDVSHTVGVYGYNIKPVPTSPTGVYRIERDVSPLRPMNNYFGGNPYGYRYPAGAILTNQIHRAEVECLLKLKDAHINLGTTLAEAKRSWNGMVESTSDLLRALIAAKRGNFRLSAKLLGITDSRQASQHYLSLQYGWAPVMSDIHGSFEAVKAALNYPSIISATRTVKTSSSFTPTGFTGTVKSELDVCVGLVGKLTDVYQRATAQAGIINPLSVGWELLPWSFAIDWVLPIGSLIEAMDATAGLSFVSGWRTSVIRNKFDIALKPSTGWEEVKPATVKGEGFGMIRSPYGDFPTPMPYVKSPFSTSHGITALALLRQLTGRR